MRNDSSLPLIDSTEGTRLAGGNKPLYLRLLSRFPDDQSASRLKDAIEHGDVHASFLCAHTLKGLSAQLALPALNKQARNLCDLLRAEDPSSLPAARTALTALLSAYNETLAAIAGSSRKTPYTP